ncbi:MAG: response regulator [Candidatus Brocadiales bacterium]
MSKIRVLIAEDHTIVRQGLSTLLRSHGSFEVVGEAKDGIEAIVKAKELLPDIILMDITMPGLSGVEATRQIKKTHPGVKIVILTMHTSKDYIHQSFQAGATCYLDKESADTDLIAALQAAYCNKAFFSPSISKIIMENYVYHTKHGTETDSLELLTPRERVIMQLICEGSSKKEIARRLYISVNTVNNHKANIMKKLKIHDTANLIRYAAKKGLIDL